MFVVWEPVLPSDLGAPSTATMNRVPDLRARQFWDPKRLLSHALGEHDRGSVVWDYLAIYPAGAMWEDAPPAAVFHGSTVVRSIGDADRALRQLPPR